jgi:hypothetical protein
LKTSDIKRLFSGTITHEEFRTLIASEVKAYDELHDKAGVTISIFFDEDDELLIGKEEMMFLCGAYLSGALGSADISYMADAFTLSEDVDFATQLIRDEVETLCWLQTDKSWSVEEVNSIIDRLNSTDDKKH